MGHKGIQLLELPLKSNYVDRNRGAKKMSFKFERELLLQLRLKQTQNKVKDISKMTFGFPNFHENFSIKSPLPSDC